MFGLFDDMFGNNYDDYYRAPRQYYRRPQTARYPQYWEDDESDSESEGPVDVFGRQAYRPQVTKQSRRPARAAAPQKQ